MAPDVRPNLVELQVLDSHILDALSHHVLATLSGENKPPHDRVAINADDPLCASERIAFAQSP
jgi:hypothetical protein